MAKRKLLSLAFGMVMTLGMAMSVSVRADDKDDEYDWKDFYRVDCRYHNVEKVYGVDFCYASAVYKAHDYKYSRVKFGVGCDLQTIYNDAGRVAIEEVGERISPKTAAFPAVEILPKGALSKVGTYESVLDIRNGRLTGTCYVQSLYEPYLTH